MADKKKVAMENHRLLKKSSWVGSPSEQEIEVTVELSCGKSVTIQDITFAQPLAMFRTGWSIRLASSPKTSFCVSQVEIWFLRG